MGAGKKKGESGRMSPKAADSKAPGKVSRGAGGRAVAEETGRPKRATRPVVKEDPSESHSSPPAASKRAKTAKSEPKNAKEIKQEPKQELKQEHIAAKQSEMVEQMAAGAAEPAKTNVNGEEKGFDDFAAFEALVEFAAAVQSDSDKAHGTDDMVQEEDAEPAMFHEASIRAPFGDEMNEVGTLERNRRRKRCQRDKTKGKLGELQQLLLSDECRTLNQLIAEAIREVRKRRTEGKLIDDGWLYDAMCKLGQDKGVPYKPPRVGHVECEFLQFGMMSCATAGFLLLSRGGVVKEVNTGFAAWTGAKREAIVGKQLSELAHNSDDTDALNKLLQAHEGTDGANATATGWVKFSGANSDPCFVELVRPLSRKTAHRKQAGALQQAEVKEDVKKEIEMPEEEKKEATKACPGSQQGSKVKKQAEKMRQGHKPAGKKLEKAKSEKGGATEAEEHYFMIIYTPSLPTVDSSLQSSLNDSKFTAKDQGAKAEQPSTSDKMDSSEKESNAEGGSNAKPGTFQEAMCWLSQNTDEISKLLDSPGAQDSSQSQYVPLVNLGLGGTPGEEKAAGLRKILSFRILDEGWMSDAFGLGLGVSTAPGSPDSASRCDGLGAKGAEARGRKLRVKKVKEVQPNGLGGQQPESGGPGILGVPGVPGVPEVPDLQQTSQTTDGLTAEQQAALLGGAGVSEAMLMAQQASKQGEAAQELQNLLQMQMLQAQIQSQNGIPQNDILQAAQCALANGNPGAVAATLQYLQALQAQMAQQLFLQRQLQLAAALANPQVAVYMQQLQMASAAAGDDPQLQSQVQAAQVQLMQQIEQGQMQLGQSSASGGLF